MTQSLTKTRKPRREEGEKGNMGYRNTLCWEYRRKETFILKNKDFIRLPKSRLQWCSTTDWNEALYAMCHDLVLKFLKPIAHETKMSWNYCKTYDAQRRVMTSDQAFANQLLKAATWGLKSHNTTGYARIVYKIEMRRPERRKSTVACWCKANISPDVQNNVKLACRSALSEGKSSEHLSKVPRQKEILTTASVLMSNHIY